MSNNSPEHLDRASPPTVVKATLFLEGDVQNRSVPASKPSLPAWSSEDLFMGHRTVAIEHQGEHYRLQRTRSGKLILTK